MQRFRESYESMRFRVCALLINVVTNGGTR